MRPILDRLSCRRSTAATAMRTVAACVLVGGACLMLAGNAAAAPGSLTYGGCLAADAAEGCFDLPFAPLAAPTGVAVSPDGMSVYVATSGGIAHFVRAPNGETTYAGCLSNDGSQGCRDLPSAPLEGDSHVAVSPDGKSVYVVARYGGIARFFRSGADGQLFYDGCLNNDGSEGCGDLPGTPLPTPIGVTVSPDGKSVYVASRTTVQGAVAHFFRAPDGQIRYDACLNDNGSDGCADLPGTPLPGPTGVTVSPDGKSVYVASSSGALGSIAHFFRNGPDGQISYDGCLGNDGSQGCVDLPGDPLQGANDVAVSPDGASVYVASYAGSIAHFFRNGPDGQLAYDGCLNDDGSQSCSDLPGSPLTGAWGVAVSTDARSVYVASYEADSIAHFLRNGPQGQLSYDGCLGNDGTHCGDLPGAPLDRAIGVAVSPDDRTVYVTSQRSNSLTHFLREPDLTEPPDTTEPPPTDPAIETPDTLAPSITGLALTNRRFRVGRGATALAARRAPVGTTLRYTLSESATLTIAFERRARGRRAGGRCRPASRTLRRRPACTRWATAGPTITRTVYAGPHTLPFTGRLGSRKLRPGAYRVFAIATDAAGNRSRSIPLGFRIVP
jgi:DNA-binding beta-propeller fold protein YncE